MRIDLTELIELRVYLILGDRTLVSNEVLQLRDLGLILLLEILDILLGDLNVTFKFKDVDEILPLISEFLLEVLDLIWGTWVLELVDYIEKHGVLVRLFHDFGHFIVQVLKQRSSGMVDDV